jgi:hypothetical protein
MAFVHPSSTNVQVAGPAAAQQMVLQTAFAKNPAKFSHLQTIQRVPSARHLGVWSQMNPDDMARIESADESPNWRDGTRRPRAQSFRFEIKPFVLDRDSQNAELGSETIDQSQFALQANYFAALANKAMLKKQRDHESVVTNVANVTNNADTTIGDIGGKLDAGTEAAPYVKRAFDYVKATIQQNTNGAVGLGEIVAYMGLETARKISRTAEIQAYLKGNPFSIDALKSSANFRAFQLPPELYGITLVIANESIVTSAEGASSTTRRGVMQGLGGTVVDPIFFGTVQGGGLQQVEAALNVGDENAAVNVPTSHTSVVEIYSEDMNTEQRLDAWHRIAEMGVANRWQHVITSPASCFLLRDVLT